jgi:hypothetical protein
MVKSVDRKEFFENEMLVEFDTILKLMKGEKSLEKRIYYFSAAYGITQRTYRGHFSKEVLLMDLILTNAYNLLLDRLNHLKNRDMTVHPEVLEKAVDQIMVEFGSLIKNLEDKKDIRDPLENILVIAYSTTGNGNYLMEKGQIVI